MRMANEIEYDEDGYPYCNDDNCIRTHIGYAKCDPDCTCWHHLPVNEQPTKIVK